MQPRITKISRIRQHPTNNAFLIVQVFGSEHRTVVKRDGQLKVNDRVLFMPVGTTLRETTAVNLVITHHCKKTEQQLCCVVALDFERVISHGIVISLFFAANQMLIENPYSPNCDALLTALRCNNVASYNKTKPLVDLIDNPSLLSVLLQTPVWVSERVRGTPVAIQYDASCDCIVYWDESNVSVPHAWWTVYGEKSNAFTLDEPSLLSAHAAALLRVGRERYGKAIDLYLRGVITHMATKDNDTDNDSAEEVYFYECALHGARSFVLCAEQFLRMCENCRFPRMPTLYSNRTLCSIINERLGKKRILLPQQETSLLTMAKQSLFKKDEREQQQQQQQQQKQQCRHLYCHERDEKSETESETQKTTRKEQKSYDYAKSAPSVHFLDASSSSANSMSTSLSTLSLSGGRERLFGQKRQSEKGEGIAARQANWRRTTPIDDFDNDFENEWFGGVSRDRIDWAQCLILIANQIYERQPNSIGLAIQVYFGGDLVRLLEKFNYMRCHVGGQVVCEQHLLKRKKI